MTHLEQAIRDAVEKGGYNPAFLDRSNRRNHDVLMIPAFWQALGKARGQDELMWPLEFESDMGVQFLYWKGPNGHQYTPHLVWWKYQMHRLIDHLASGKDVESFFKELN